MVGSTESAMRSIWAIAILLALAGPALAQDSCADLAIQRNAIFKRAGFCFKTPAMIRTFGNAGCQYDDQRDVPLSERDRAEIASISRLEHTMGCR